MLYMLRGDGETEVFRPLYEIAEDVLTLRHDFDDVSNEFFADCCILRICGGDEKKKAEEFAERTMWKLEDICEKLGDLCEEAEETLWYLGRR